MLRRRRTRAPGKRRLLRMLVAACAAGLFLLSAVPVRGGEAEGPLLIGTDWPYDASEETKALFHEAGFNFVRVAGGGYAWSAERHVQAVEELEGKGVRVLLQLGSHYPSGEYFRFKDSWFVDHQGETGQEDRSVWAITYSGKAWPQYSYASEETRRQFERDFVAYLEQFRRFGNIVGVCLDNEPGLHWLRDRIFDYSPPAISKFRAWLEQRYGTVERLNDAWAADYDSFASVEPPREGPPVGNIAAWLDWRRANVAFIRDFLQWEIALVRRTWPGLAVTTNLAGPLDWWHPWRCSDSFRFTEGMDIAGIDIYPSEWGTRHFPAYTMDLTSGVGQGRPVHVIECEVYSPEKWPDLTRDQRVGMLRSEVWTYIGHGARGILLWGLSQRGDNCLTRGEHNPRVAVMREITHLCRMLDVGRFRRPRAEIAVVVNADAYFYFAGTEEDPPYFLDKACTGAYGAARDAGYAVDVIFAEQVRRGVGDNYRALLLPCPVMTDQPLADRLKRFVREGGLLVAEAPFAEVDGHGRRLPRWPGQGLEELFGIRATESQVGRGPIEALGTEMTAAGPRRDVAAGAAEVIGSFPDGRPAVTSRGFGAGRAVYVASCVSVPYCDGWGTWAKPGLRTLLDSLIRRHAGVTPAVRVECKGKDALDTAVLEDDRGNRLVVLSLLSDRGKAPQPASDVRVFLPVEMADPESRFWVFRPTREQDGTVRSVPQELRPVMGGLPRRLLLDVGTVASCVLVLQAHDAGPLLGLVAPATVPKGAGFTVTANCVNASPDPVAGTLDLILPAACKNVTGARHVRIRPGGEETVSFEVQAGAVAQRVVVKASFTPEGGVPTLSVPVDVYAK